jgi:hypothetical protein
MQWPDITFPPINLWSLPKMTKQVAKNESAFDFNLLEEVEELEILDTKVLKDLYLKEDFDWENERGLEDLYGAFDE